MTDALALADAVVPVFVLVLAALGWVIRRIIARLDSHDSRLGNLEREQARTSAIQQSLRQRVNSGPLAPGG